MCQFPTCDGHIGKQVSHEASTPEIDANLLHLLRHFPKIAHVITVFLVSGRLIRSHHLSLDLLRRCKHGKADWSRVAVVVNRQWFRTGSNSVMRKYSLLTF